MVDTATQAESLTPEAAREFRERVAAFLDDIVVSMPTREQEVAYMGALADAGLGGTVYAREHGGAGLTKAHDKIFREETAKRPSMSNSFVISHGMCLPVLNQFGTDEQKRRYMPDNIAGRTIWCQMFSEPGAGSDVASLQMRAERDGDEWILNGQKVWTTYAHVSDFGVIIARTDPDVPKHAGISMFILPMDAPGVEIRPIHQIDGNSEFNEVFLTDVRVPADHLLGELNNGWNQATAMLMYERVAIGTAGGGKISQHHYRQLKAAAEASGRLGDANVRQDLMRVYSMETAKSVMSLRTRAELKAGRAPGPGGSLGKLFGSMIQWRVRQVHMNMAGPGSQAWMSEADGGGDEARSTLTSFMSSIAGGTDEIQRNIIGDRVLGLPRDISVDKGVPFNELKVGTQTSD